MTEKYTPVFVVTAKTTNGETVILAVHLSMDNADANAVAMEGRAGVAHLVPGSVRVDELALSK